jgi:hypothetical protein
MSETGGGTQALESAITDRLDASRELIEASKFRRRLFGGLLIFLCVSLVGIMTFQAWQNYQGSVRRRSQDQVVRELTARITADDQFFDTVRRLILLPPNAPPEQRQEILKELEQQQEERNKATAPKGSGKAPGGGSTNPSVHSSPNTTQKPSPQSPSSPPSTQSPPATTAPPTTQAPTAQACVQTTCVTVPPLPHP